VGTPPILPKPSKDYPETIDNRAVLEELEVVKEGLSREEVLEYVPPVKSRDHLQQLETEKENLSALIALIGASSVVGLTAFSSGTLWLLLPLWKPMTRLEKVARLCKVIAEILDEFEDWGVETLPLIEVPKYQPIDLFVRFPGKEFLLFAIRSHGKSTIVYNDANQWLYQKRGSKGRSRWKPDPLIDLSEQAYWLRKNRRDLFGSSKGVRKPMAKVLVLWGKTQLGQHQEHMYKQIGDQKFLFITREEGACYVIHQSQMINFIRAWLVHRQKA
jgi:hypothetical protein